MEITGTVEDPEGGHSRVTAAGASYEEARLALEAMIPEGNRLIVIRTTL
ncbi:hypothetical protein [Arthrobacter sp. ISL-5]|nr:hypothetical protein [Arthrobacter sp. ISL-5]MBT2555615.1 hypothetical protein [Arthrobacter sp. ISL-5]